VDAAPVRTEDGGLAPDHSSTELVDSPEEPKTTKKKAKKKKKKPKSLPSRAQAKVLEMRLKQKLHPQAAPVLGFAAQESPLCPGNARPHMRESKAPDEDATSSHEHASVEDTHDEHRRPSVKKQPRRKKRNAQQQQALRDWVEKQLATQTAMTASRIEARLGLRRNVHDVQPAQQTTVVDEPANEDEVHLTEADRAPSRTSPELTEGRIPLQDLLLPAISIEPPRPSKSRALEERSPDRNGSHLLAVTVTGASAVGGRHAEHIIPAVDWGWASGPEREVQEEEPPPEPHHDDECVQDKHHGGSPLSSLRAKTDRLLKGFSRVYSQAPPLAEAVFAPEAAEEETQPQEPPQKERRGHSPIRHGFRGVRNRKKQRRASPNSKRPPPRASTGFAQTLASGASLASIAARFGLSSEDMREIVEEAAEEEGFTDSQWLESVLQSIPAAPPDTEEPAPHDTQGPHAQDPESVLSVSDQPASWGVGGETSVAPPQLDVIPELPVNRIGLEAHPTESGRSSIELRTQRSRSPIQSIQPRITGAGHMSSQETFGRSEALNARAALEDAVEQEATPTRLVATRAALSQSAIDAPHAPPPGDRAASSTGLVRAVPAAQSISSPPLSEAGSGEDFSQDYGRVVHDRDRTYIDLV
jgi:hypothetical protein